MISNYNIPHLVQLMDDIYSYIYKERVGGERPPDLATTRELPHSNYRHLVRYMIQRECGSTYQAIAQAEADLFGIEVGDISKIGNSIGVVNSRLKNDEDYVVLIRQISFMFDLSRGYRDRGMNYCQAINKMMNLPKHVLAITLASVQHHELVYQSILSTLINSYSELDYDFIESMINHKQTTEALHGK